MVFYRKDTMKSLQFILVVFTTTLYSNFAIAGVFKCTDASGNTSYQASSCAKKNKSVVINIRTGVSTDLPNKDKQKAISVELEKQQKKGEENQKALEAKRKKDSEEQSAINQQLIKDNPIQYSAFAIPPYIIDKLPELVKPHKNRLPEIEKFRRLAAKKALANGECFRVESDELSIKSKPENLFFSIDCSSAKTFIFSEAELSE